MDDATTPPPSPDAAAAPRDPAPGPVDVDPASTDSAGTDPVSIDSAGIDPVSVKKELRRRIRAARSAALAGTEDRGADGLRDAAAPLLPRLREIARKAGSVTISAFWPSPSEPDVLAVVALVREMVETEGAALHVLFPAASGGEMLDWIDGDEREGAEPSTGRGFGDEPRGERAGTDALSRADLVLAPALAVDRDGTRLGHGGGYYDRALPHRRPGTPVVAVVHPVELLEPGALVREAHDEPVDGVLTADGLLLLEA